MRILVCVKQVPDTAEIKIDPVTNTLIRAGVPSIVNPFDACALEVAARIKDADPSTEITLLSMGPDQAKDALRECLAVGGDKAYLCSDRKFGGSDTLATSYILASAIQSIEEKEGKFSSSAICHSSDAILSKVYSGRSVWRISSSSPSLVCIMIVFFSASQYQ